MQSHSEKPTIQILSWQKVLFKCVNPQKTKPKSASQDVLVAGTAIYQQVPVGKLVRAKHWAYLNITEQLPDEVWSSKQWGALQKKMKWKLVQSWSHTIIYWLLGLCLLHVTFHGWAQKLKSALCESHTSQAEP